MIYADHAATTQLDIDAFEAMKPYLMGEFGNPSQPYSFARGPKKAVQEAREKIAACIGARPEEIYFTSGGTESDNWAIKVASKRSEARDEILTSAIEHHAILHALKSMEREDFKTGLLPVDGQGIVTPAALQARITDRTALVSVMLSNNEVGTVEPIRELADIAHASGALFHTDAVQSLGHIPVQVNELQADLLSASAHKFNGPKGIGFLYVREGVTLSSFHDGGAQEMGLRAGTEDVASIVGMATALDKSCGEMEATAAHLRGLETQLLEQLRTGGADFIRNGTNQVPGNMSLSFRGMQGEMLLHRLDLKGICVSTGSACDSQNTNLSHVLSAMGVPEEYAFGTIRISLGRENTAEEVDTIGRTLLKIIGK